jgi:hypothetical protein
MKRHKAAGGAGAAGIMHGKLKFFNRLPIIELQADSGGSKT